MSSESVQWNTDSDKVDPSGFDGVVTLKYLSPRYINVAHNLAKLHEKKLSVVSLLQTS